MSALVTLACNFGQVTSRARMHEILCLSKEGHRDKAAISHHISRIRKVLGDSSKNPHVIKTIRGGGFYLLKEPRLEAPAAWSSSPYRGLKPFNFEHAPIFFGRTDEVNVLFDKVQKRCQSGLSLLLISGPSGAGKSSIVKAGLLPKIHDWALETGLFAHAVFHFKGSQNALFDDFANGLLLAIPELIESFGDAKNIAKCAMESPTTLNSKLDLDKRNIRLAIVFDQLDELIAANDVSADELDLFFSLLLALAENPRCDLIGTVRLDFLNHCLKNSVIGPKITNHNLHVLTPPSLSGVREMIVRPAQLKGIEFETTSNGHNLCDKIIEDSYPHFEALPTIAYALELLYDGANNGIISFTQYNEIGGIKGCLARRCENEYQALTPHQRASLGGVLARLTTIDSMAAHRGVARTARWNEVAVNTASEILLIRFLEARILTITRNSNGEKSIRLAHEAVLSEWGRAKQWLEKNNELVLVHSKLRSDSSQWLSSNKDSSLLLPPGIRLSEAEQLLDSDLILEPSANEFINESMTLNKRRHKRKRLLNLSITAAAVLFATLSVFTSLLGVRYWHQLKTANELRMASDQISQRASVERDIALSTSQLMIETFSLETPNNSKEATVSAQELLTRKLKSVDTDESLSNSEKAAHLSALGRAFLGLSSADKGIELLERALILQRKNPQEDQLQLAQTLSSIATGITKQRHQIERAKTLISESIEIYKSHAHSTKALARAIADYADMLQYEGKFDDAEVMHKKAITMLPNSQNGNQSLRRNLQLELARNLTLQSKFNEAELLSTMLLENDRKRLADNHPDLVASVSQYAYWLYSKGNLISAVEYYDEALEIQKRNYPHDHWRVAASQGRLGHLLVQTGNYQRAISTLRKAITAATKFYGDQGTRVGIYKISLADALLHINKPQEAKTLALEIKKLIQSKEGRPVGGLDFHADSLLGAAFSQLGECEQGLTLLNSAYQNSVDSLGKESPYSIEFQQRLKQHKESYCSP